jgi:hypothetical protein
MTAQSFVHVNVAGKTLRTTADHPFHVQGKGWINAADLQAGDLINNVDGTSAPVLWVAVTETSISGFLPKTGGPLQAMLDGALPAGTLLLTSEGLNKVEDISPEDSLIVRDPQHPDGNPERN